MMDRTIFKAYDVRGIFPEQVNKKVSGRIGEAFAAVLHPKKVGVGRDVRDSGESLKSELIEALLASGVDVVDIGVITTDQLYFSVGKYGFDAGISVTASHNPSQYNGLKFSESGGAPISSENLKAISDWAVSDRQAPRGQRGKLSKLEIIDDYIEHVLSYIDTSNVKPFHILANANFGAVGRGVDKIAEKLNLKLDRLNWSEDGSFPKGPPNPQLPENRDETVSMTKKLKPDFTVAWDADADRVFFYTTEGLFIQSCYVVALLAQIILEKYPRSKIIHDVSTSWAISDAVKKAGGTPVMNRTGHTFIKRRMRQEDAPFAGESSGHYYFRDSFYADNGIVPFLMLIEQISKTGKSLGELVQPLMKSNLVSGEINFTVENPQRTMDLIESKLGREGEIDRTDGIAINSKGWRICVRSSNTEPLIRFNAEAHNQQTIDKLIQEISKIINT